MNHSWEQPTIPQNLNITISSWSLNPGRNNGQYIQESFFFFFLYFFSYRCRKYKSSKAILLLEWNWIGTSIWVFDSLEVVHTHTKTTQQRIAHVFQLSWSNKKYGIANYKYGTNYRLRWRSNWQYPMCI